MNDYWSDMTEKKYSQQDIDARDRELNQPLSEELNAIYRLLTFGEESEEVASRAFRGRVYRMVEVLKKEKEAILTEFQKYIPYLYAHGFFRDENYSSNEFGAGTLTVWPPQEKGKKCT